MAINKQNISKGISKKLSTTSADSLAFLDTLLSLVKSNSKLKIVKLSGFGSFNYKKTPARMGRNPKTEESYIIPELNKLKFKASNKIKEALNK